MKYSKLNTILYSLWRLFLLWGTIMVIMTFARVCFVLFEPTYNQIKGALLGSILWHGIPTDLSMSAYLMIIPSLYSITTLWCDNKFLKVVFKVYLWIIAAIISFAYILDAVLFDYWNFRLDVTPFYYFFSSPVYALASLPLWVEILLACLIILLTTGLYFLLIFLWGQYKKSESSLPRKSKIVATVTLLLYTVALIIPIRGGVSEATMTPGRGFFSDDSSVNQATINPLFSLFYALIHSDNLEKQFRFFATEEEAETILYTYEKKNIEKDPVPTVKLKTSSPDIYIIILESFSSHLMPVLGGDSIAMSLNQLAQEESVFFTNFYAESFRTDRALPAILSGYPAQPTTSVMRYTSKLNNLPSIIRELRKEGWRSHYYYGGDADFTNMKAYLLASGIDELITEDNFPAENKRSKWGVPDGVLFDKVINGLKSNKIPNEKVLTIIQTSSSHEPYDVPVKHIDDKILNSFVYTDKSLAKFIDELKKGGYWQNSLVLIVADHWGSYPSQVADFKERHHIPFIISGGVIEDVPQKIDVIGSQSDIAPTVMSLLGLPAKAFVFGHNLFDTEAPKYARISDRDRFGLINNANEVSEFMIDSEIDSVEKVSESAQAFLQLLYSDLNKR